MSLSDPRSPKSQAGLRAAYAVAPSPWFGDPVLVDPDVCGSVRVLPSSPYAFTRGPEGGRSGQLWQADGPLPRRCEQSRTPGAFTFPSGQSGTPGLMELTARDDTGHSRTRVRTPPEGPPGPWTPPVAEPQGVSACGLARVDGQWVLAVGDVHGTCALWDPATGEHRLLPHGSPHHHNGVDELYTAGPSDRPLAVATASTYVWEDYGPDYGGTLEIFYAVVYDLTTAEEVFRVSDLDVEMLCAVGQAEHGWLIAAATQPAYTIRCFDALTGASYGTSVPHSDDLTALAVGMRGPGGDAVLVTGTDGGEVRFWDAQDGGIRGAWRMGDHVNDLAVHPDMGLLIATDSGLWAAPPLPCA